MNQEAIDKAIYDKYIAPTLPERTHFMGIEIELPVVNLKGVPVEEGDIHQLSAAFMEYFSFTPGGTDSDGHVNSMQHPDSGDDLSYDCSYSNLELSLGKGTDLFAIKERFDTYYAFINSFLSRYGCTLTGMGINPAYRINHNRPVPNERYRMLYHYLHSYKRHRGETGKEFHDFPAFGTFTSASQVQIDVQYENLTDTINTFNLLEPYKSLLFANSLLPERPDLLCSRNMLWEHSMQGYNPHNIGMFEYTLRSEQDIVEYIKTQSIYCTMRDGRYVDFTPVPIGEYLLSERPVTGEYFDGETYRTVQVTPMPEDLQYLRTFKFEDLTFRGTIEYRSSCCQPVSDSMTVAAFHAGLLEKLPELKETLEGDTVIYGHGFSPAELQRILSKRELPFFLDRKALSAQLVKLVSLAEEGLKARGLGEEVFLAPLFDRGERLTSPARRMAEGLEKGVPMEQFIHEYAQLKEVSV